MAVQIPPDPVLNSQVPWVDAFALFATTTTPANALAEDPPLTAEVTASAESENTGDDPGANRELTVAPLFRTTGLLAEVA